MSEEILYVSLLIISGILVSTLSIIFLCRVSNKLVRLFELYPESKSILKLSLRFISWFIGLILFLFFLRWALVVLNRQFTIEVIENVIKNSHNYLLAVVLLLLGFYSTRLIKERTKNHDFEFKGRIILSIDFIILMTFAFTALKMISIDTTFFIEFYKAVLWFILIIAGLTISLSIGIPLGLKIYDKTRRNKKRRG